MIGHIISLIWHYVLSCCCSVSSSSWFIYTCEFLLSFHFIIICDQRSVPTASPPDCPSTLASRKGKSWEIKSAVFKILCLWSECFKVYLDSMIILSSKWAMSMLRESCKRAKNMIICSDLFYILFFFSILLVVAKLFYSEREFQGKYCYHLLCVVSIPHTHLLNLFFVCFLVAFCISVL